MYNVQLYMQYLDVNDVTAEYAGVVHQNYARI